MSELTPEMLGYLYDAPWPATKEQLIDFAERNGLPEHVIEALSNLESREYEPEDFQHCTDDLYETDDDEYSD